MPALVAYRIQASVATITITHPPKNTLSAAVRAALADALRVAEADRDVRVIVLTASGRTWPAGVDLREYDLPRAQPSLGDLCAAVAGCCKPVIAALHGAALDGGLELALAADFRLAAARTSLGLPDVSLGLLPGAGATQRLPRLIGAKAALGLMLTGLPIGAERAQEIGLIDHVTDSDVAVAAATLAADVAVGKLSLPPVGRKDFVRDAPGDFLAEVAVARKGLSDPRLPAPMRIVDCVEAALLLPEDEGHTYEQTAFEDLLATPQSAALRHAFVALRRARRPAELAGVLPRQVSHIGVIGAGQLGAAVTSSLLSAGYTVSLVDPDANVLARGLSSIAATHEAAIARGALTPQAREVEWDHVAGATSFHGLVTADLAIETTGGNAEAVGAIFSELTAVLRPSTVLITMSEARQLDSIAAAAARPDDLIGLGCQNRWDRDKLAEVVVGTHSAPAVVATLLMLLRRIGKTAVRVRAGNGTLGQRMTEAYRAAVDSCQRAGATREVIDRAMTDFGFVRGPFQSGLMSASETPVADPVPAPMTPAPMSAQAIPQRVLAALANEGARLVEEGSAYCPSDIDLVMIVGFGFPRWRGGPMQTADQAGLLQIRNDLRAYADADGAFWHPADLWDELIKNGLKFVSLNGD